MTKRSMGSVALVAAMALLVPCCAERGGNRDVADEPVIGDWGLESVAWTQQFFELTNLHGGLGASPFLAPDVVLDHRTFTGPGGYREGIDAAIELLDGFTGEPDPVSERWVYSDAPYLDPDGVVVTAEVNVGPDPHDATLHRYAAMVMDVGLRGIEREIAIPSSHYWIEREQAGRTGHAERAEQHVAAWTEAWGDGDAAALGRLYTADAVLQDEVVGVNVRGRSAIVDRWAVTPEAGRRLIDHDDGWPAVYLWFPPFEDTDGRIAVLAELLVDDGDGCPGRLAVWWELDGFDRISLERRFRSAADVRRCEPIDRLPDGWWTGRAPPALSGTAELEDLETVTHVITEGGHETAIRNGTPSLAALVGWALGRFDLAGLPLPEVRIVTFTSVTAYCDDIQGRAIELADSDPVTGEPLDGGWQVVLCLDDDDLYIDDLGVEPSPRARNAVLHEFSHVWLDQHLDATTRRYFLDTIGLETWNSHEYPWDERGFEWAACIVAWGLNDTSLRMFELDEPPMELRFQGFQLLTGRCPLRPADLSG